MNSEKKQEFTRRITQANSTEMIIILYDMTLEYITEAKASENSEDYHAAIGHIQGCISELQASLNYEYEPAPAMGQLYRYCLRRVAAGEIKNDPSILDEVVKVIQPLRDAYDQIKGENTAGPVMGNSQEVYAGLTYGRNDITENYVEQSNRGFRV